ncbi:MAG: peptidase M48 Ste24p, partial [Desulfobulbaceae bacterium]|nr:peptidase M48 Ste24p [Desulfobulbaceae bacterium]
RGVLGICALNRKQYVDAYAAFTEYDLMLPGNPDVTFYKGYSLENLHDKQRAGESYSRYLQMVNQGPKAQHAYGKLKEWGYISQGNSQRR